MNAPTVQERRQMIEEVKSYVSPDAVKKRDGVNTPVIEIAARCRFLLDELTRKDQEHAEEIEPYICSSCNGDGFFCVSGLDPQTGRPTQGIDESCRECSGTGLRNATEELRKAHQEASDRIKALEAFARRETNYLCEGYTSGRGYCYEASSVADGWCKPCHAKALLGLLPTSQSSAA